MSENSSPSPAPDGRSRRRGRVAILGVAIALLVVGCGGGTSQDELERRIVELEDELERVATATTEPGPTTTVAPPTTTAPTTTAPRETTTSAAPPATTTSLPPVDDRLVFDARGFGPIEAGMSLRTVEAVAGIVPNIDEEIFEVFEGYCYYATLEEIRFADLSLLIVSPGAGPVHDPLDGIVGSVSTYRSGPTTSGGIGVGSTEAEVYAAYPDQITALPHAYQDGGRYLDVAEPAADGSVFYLRFVTDGATVTSISSGSDAARNVEGCA